MKKIFNRPLVLGASISAGHGTRDGGIGAVLSRMVNPETKVTNLARSGHTSLQSTAHLNFEKFDPSIVLAFDLFFWDAVKGQIGSQFEANTKKIFKSFQDRNIPMIVGKIPIVDLPFGNHLAEIKRNALKVNAFLNDLSFASPRTLLYDPLPCYMSMETDEYFSDGLHLTDKGNEYCAKFFLSSFPHDKLRAS